MRSTACSGSLLHPGRRPHLMTPDQMKDDPGDGPPVRRVPTFGLSYR
ncbi:MAG: hypothetical protein ACLTYN_10915 [Dysosmobacter welbionis]